jgi:hypothetical protein
VNNKSKIFKQLLGELKEEKLNMRDCHDIDCFECFMELLCDDIDKFSKYTYDGRFQKILLDGLVYAYKHSLEYSEFLCYMKTELEKLSVPCIIIIPLNFLNDKALENDIYLSENIVLFKTDKPKIKFGLFKDNLFTETPLSKYFKDNIYANLLREHILNEKDKNFFNFPILTLLINNIDARVEIESGRIVEAVYALLRMLDFKNELEEGGWGYLMHSDIHPAHTYGVYYNKEGIDKLPIGADADGYGYSMRFKFQQFLDVSTTGVLAALDNFEIIIMKYINYCFMEKTNFSQKQLTKIARWQNSFQMFNTAYELAAKERYDSALLLLLIILESLFIKNKGNKKENLVLALQEFFNNETIFDNDFIRRNIEQAYQSRNKYVHEGGGS